LIGSLSVLTDESLWTRENFELLDRYYAQNLNEGEGDFFSKLEGQLDAAPGAAKRLMAELFWIMYLMIHERAMHAETKRLRLTLRLRRQSPREYRCVALFTHPGAPCYVLADSHRLPVCPP
jgi:hypothetical protein